MERVGRQTHPLRQPEPIAISLVVEWVGGAVARRYAHGPGVDEPLVWYEGAGATTPRWLIADRQGSIIATTDAAGAATVLSG